MATQVAASSNSGDALTASVAHTVPSGTDLVSYLYFFRNGATSITSIANFGGQTPARIDDGRYPDLSIYRVINPAPGPTSASATLASSALFGAHVITVAAVDQEDPDGALVYATNSEQAAISSPAISSAVDDVCVAFGFVVSQDIAAANGSTLSSAEQAIEGAYRSTAAALEAGAASVVMGFSCTASFGDNYIVAIPVHDAGAVALIPTVNDVNGANAITATQVGNVANGTNLAGVSVQITQGSTTVNQTVTATTATTATFTTVFDVGSGPHLRYGAASVYAIGSGGPSAARPISINAPAGRKYVTLTSLYSDASKRITAVPDFAVGDQLEISSVTGGTIADVSVNGDGTFDVAAAVTAFTVRAWAANDSTWGSSAVQTIS
jgi:hypothetical protein